MVKVPDKSEAPWEQKSHTQRKSNGSYRSQS
jgi:hypothetical protein